MKNLWSAITSPLTRRRKERELTDKMKDMVFNAVIERTGPHGERIFLQELAPARDTEHYVFKVYTSQKALDNHGIVTTIWTKDVELSPDQFELVSDAFTDTYQEYINFMSFVCDDDQWNRIANGESFEVNALNRIALKEGYEVSIMDYINNRRGVVYATSATP